MECNGKIMQTVFETNHYADDYGRHKGSSVNFPADDLDRSTWHTYAICWEPGALAWYLDDEYKGTTRTPDARIPDMPMYVRFNLAVGAWSGDPAKSSWPQDMECDYVRIYQRSDMPLPVYPAHSMEITLPNNSATLSAISCNPMTGATATWSLAEGPSGATIQNPSAMTTKATFTKPGMYRFNLRIAKGSSMASRDLLVYVNSAGNSQ